jgi:Uma2 family endonuclease
MTAVAPTPNTAFAAIDAIEATPRPWKWSRQDYYRLAELGFFQGRRVELIRGDIVAMSPVKWPHTVSLAKIAEALRAIFAGMAWINTQNPFSISDSDPQPDVAVIPGRIEDYSDHPGTALLIVEVADATLFYDTTTKAELYVTALVPEYWVLDLEHRLLHGYRDPAPLSPGLAATAYQTHQTLDASASISPLAMTGSTIYTAELLP